MKRRARLTGLLLFIREPQVTVKGQMLLCEPTVLSEQLTALSWVWGGRGTPFWMLLNAISSSGHSVIIMVSKCSDVVTVNEAVNYVYVLNIKCKFMCCKVYLWDYTEESIFLFNQQILPQLFQHGSVCSVLVKCVQWNKSHPFKAARPRPVSLTNTIRHNTATTDSWSTISHVFGVAPVSGCDMSVGEWTFCPWSCCADSRKNG